jgi:hypothetical protein
MDATERMGYMSEWAAAFGLSLKLTKGQFAPRDGKPRDPAAPNPAAAAEVIDIAKVVEAVPGDAGGRKLDPQPAAVAPSVARMEQQPAHQPAHQPPQEAARA